MEWTWIGYGFIAAVAGGLLGWARSASAPLRAERGEARAETAPPPALRVVRSAPRRRAA